MEIGYSKADVAQAYYKKVMPERKYDNYSAKNQFRQDKNIDWDIVLDVINELNVRSFNAAMKIRKIGYKKK